MTLKPIYDLDSSQLKAYIDTHAENEYALIDVRQPSEYAAGHLPGASLVPFPTMGTEDVKLPKGVDLIFICHAGKRSRAAALFASEMSDTSGQLYNLAGGIRGWQGKTLSQYPNIRVLGKTDDIPAMLLAAMDLEKGAWNFYKAVLAAYPEAPFIDDIEYLTLAEANHAETIYSILIKKDSTLPLFEDMFHAMKGDILEGGLSFKEVLNTLDALDKDKPPMLLDLALDIEYSAFDLYRSTADIVQDPEMKKLLMGIANGEKNHMKKLARAFESFD